MQMIFLRYQNLFSLNQNSLNLIKNLDDVSFEMKNLVKN